MTIAAKLRRLRQLSGLTQDDVSRLSGVGVKTLSSYETGDRTDSIRVKQLEAILVAYGCTLAEFFTPNHVEMLRERWEMSA